MCTKSEIIKYIQSLSEKEIIDFFYEATENRGVFKKYPDGFHIETLCLVQSSFGEYDNEIEKESYHEFMALPSSECKNLDWVKNEKVATQQGRCTKCKVDVLCVTKKAICPVCKELIWCT